MVSSDAVFSVAYHVGVKAASFTEVVFSPPHRWLCFTEVGLATAAAQCSISLCLNDKNFSCRVELVKAADVIKPAVEVFKAT